jgi:hypothetical protein
VRRLGRYHYALDDRDVDFSYAVADDGGSVAAPEAPVNR